VLADAGVENVNAQVEELITTGVLRRLLAFTDLKFSNSMIEAWWRSLKHQWLFLHSLDSVTTVRRLVTFYVEQHNRVLPHPAFHGQTPDEMYFGTGDAVPEDLLSRAADARRTPVEANRSASCEICPSAVHGRMTWSVERLSDRTPRACTSGGAARRTGNRTSQSRSAEPAS